MKKDTDKNRGQEESQIDEDDKDMSSTIVVEDNRIRWIRERVLTFLGLFGQEHLFNELINANNRYFEDKLINFLILDLHGITDLEKKLIFFYKTYTSEVYHEEISIWEEKKLEDEKKIKRKPRRVRRGKGILKKEDVDLAKPTTMSLSTLHDSSVSSSEDEGYEDTREDSATSSDVFEKPKEPKSVLTDSSDFAPPPGEENKYVLTKENKNSIIELRLNRRLYKMQLQKIVEKVRKVPVLHMICGQIDGSRTDLPDTTFFYFMRTSDEGVPSFDTYEECLDEIPSYVVVGSLGGKFLASFNSMLVQVFKPLVENQFRGPDFFERWKLEKTEDEPSIERQISALTADEESVTRKPSDFRKKASEAHTISATLLQDEADELKKKTPTEDDRKSHISESKSTISTISLKDMKKPMTEQCKKDILYHLDNLIKSAEWTLEHIESDILLTMPKISELSDPAMTDEMLLENKNIVEQMEQEVMSWEKHIQKMLESYKSKIPPEKGPMGEYQYWQECETGLTILVEQLKVPIVKRIFALLEQAHSPIASSFEYFRKELWKQYVEARDNKKFIQTLLRYFKLMAEPDSFQSIAEFIPALMEELRMLWVLSSYYCHEEKMMLLMERITWELCQNVRKNLSIVLLFKKPLEEILQKTSMASTMMRQWKRSYLKTRMDIELLGKSARWEFDQKRLFQDTEYIAEVCSDLHKIANVLQDFYNIFGSELKSIINDPAQIDTVVKRVDALVVPIEEADFDIFNVFNKENWEALTKWFYEEVSYLEDQAKFYIDECFAVLINAENALEMLLKFKNIKTRAAIQQLLLRKFDVIMQQFSKEVNTVEDIYQRNKRYPPLLTYHPPMAGAIYWVRQLFHRLRRPVLIFQQVRELKHSETKLIAFSRYLEIAKQMKDFEENKFNTWLEKALLTVTSFMKKSVVRIVRVDHPDDSTFPEEQQGSKNIQLVHLASKTKTKNVVESILSIQDSLKHNNIISKPSVETAYSVSSRNVIAQPRPDAKTDTKRPSLKDGITSTAFSDKHGTRVKSVYTEFTSDGILAERQLRFQLNFDWEIFEVIREAELMEQLGFELPAALRDIGVQKNRLRTDIDVTEKMIDQYNHILDTLNEANMRLLKKLLQDVEKHIQPGVTRFTWNSLSISDYAASCHAVLKNLNSIVDQVNQMETDLDNQIKSELESYNLFSTKKEIAESEVLLPCKTYFLEVKSRRSELVLSMSKTYQSISPLLIKLESLVLETSTGNSLDMQLLYEKYEKKIFEAFIMCMVKNLKYMNKLLNDTKPIFQADAVLVASEVILRPSPNEINTIICQDAQDLLERLKGFFRWMHGTCLECQPLQKQSSQEFVTFSFFEDVMSVRIINDLVKTIKETANRISMECWQYMYRWKKYSNLWSHDKNLVCEKFAATKPLVYQYDEKLAFYEGIREEVEDMAPYFGISSVRLNLTPLLSGIKSQVQEWKQVLGNYLLADTVQAMKEMKAQIENFRSAIELVVTGLDRFTLIIQAIADIRKMASQAEVQYVTYRECFRTLRTYGIEFPPEDEAMAYQLHHDWESLYLGSLYRSSTLEKTFDRFSELTEDEIQNFLAEIESFAEDFEAHGPGSIGNDLDLGLKKMEEYDKLITTYNEKRLRLIKSEILFNLPPADYSAFLKIKTEYENMEILYNLYKQQRKARDDWAKTLWVNLNPQQLIDGMENFMREFRRLPKHLKTMNVGHALDTDMRIFKNSVPLFVQLKHEAMRDRHWEQLMKRTGQHFDMDPNRCAQNDSDS